MTTAQTRPTAGRPQIPAADLRAYLECELYECKRQRVAAFGRGDGVEMVRQRNREDALRDVLTWAEGRARA